MCLVFTFLMDDHCSIENDCSHDDIAIHFQPSIECQVLYHISPNVITIHILGNRPHTWATSFLKSHLNIPKFSQKKLKLSLVCLQWSQIYKNCQGFATNSNSQCPNVSTTPLRQWGFRQCLLFSWTTLRGKHCRHPISVI